DQRDETDDERAYSYVSRHVNKSALERVVAVNFEIVRLVRSQSTRNAHGTDAAIERPIVGILRERLRRDVDGAFRFAVVLEEARDRHDHKVVLALAEGGPFFREHAHDRVDVPADANDFADRRFVWKQSFLDYLSDDDHASRK